MELLKKLASLNEDAQKEGALFYGKGNKSAGVRLRKIMQDIKAVSQQIRESVVAKKD